MGKRVIEKNYHRLDPVGQNDMCKTCSTACKTSCSRKLAQEIGNEVAYIIEDKKDKPVEIKRFYDVIIKEVDSIPCDLKNQKLSYDVDGNLLDGKLIAPWPMDWIYDEISQYLKEDVHLSGTKLITFINPEEQDQSIECNVVSYINRI